MVIKILVWNAKGLRNKKAELENKVKDYNFAVITETKAISTKSINIAGYEVLRKESKINNNTRTREVAIYIKKGIKTEIIKNIRNTSSNIDAIGVKVKILEGNSINIVGVYRRPYGIEKSGTWSNIINSIKDEERVIIAGDFNAHHQVWNCPKTDKNGEKLLDEIEEEEIFIINTQTLSRQGNFNQRSSNIDLITGSRKIVQDSSYYQIDDTWGSDRYPIEVTINETCDEYSKKSFRISTKKTDWKLYEKLIQNREERFKDIMVNENN